MVQPQSCTWPEWTIRCSLALPIRVHHHAKIYDFTQKYFTGQSSIHMNTRSMTQTVNKIAEDKNRQHEQCEWFGCT